MYRLKSSVALCALALALALPLPLPQFAHADDTLPSTTQPAASAPADASPTAAATLPPVVVERPPERNVKPKPSRQARAANRSRSRTGLAPRAPAPQASPPEKKDPATALGSYDPALELPGLKLPPGTTITTAGPVNGYNALSAYSATKTATPIGQIPQSIQVVPRSVIDGQDDVTVTEALQNVSNVQGANALGIANTSFSPLMIRGFQAQLWVDGMNSDYAAGDRDTLVNVERIEVLKGPNAILYGGGIGSPVGGAVNLVSKLPTDTASTEAGVTVGSFGYVQPYFDINQPLTAKKDVLFRFTGAFTSSGSYIDDLNSQRYSLNPTLTFTNKSDTTLTIQGGFSRFNQPAYEGLPAVGTVSGVFRIDPNMFIGNVPSSYTEANGVTATLDHSFDSVWSFNVMARFVDQSFDQRSQTTVSAAPDVGPSTWSLWNVDVAQQQQDFAINPNVTARFNAGPTQNVWLTGADYSHIQDSGHMFSDYGVVPPVDLLNDPVFPVAYTNPSPASPTFFPNNDYNSTYVTAGAYTQLQSTIYDRIHVLGGLRLANINIDYLENYPVFAGGAYLPTKFYSDTTRLLPKVGAVVDLVQGLSVYGSYSEGMTATPFTQAVSVNIAPETSQEAEAGFKINAWDQLTGTIAFFDIQRQNVPVTIGPGIAALSAQQSQGYEADLIWQPNSNWKFLASYGHTHAVFSDSNTGVPAGNLVNYVPANSGRLWATYAFDGKFQGLTAGAGVYVASSQYVDTLNLYQTPGYYTVDANLGYKWSNYTASIDVKNLTGEKYFVPYQWFGGQVAPGAPRSFFAKLAVKF